MCGDHVLVTTRDDGSILAAVIDGVGHGVAAADAAYAAADVVLSHRQSPLERILTEVHEALRGTRGAAMALVHLDRDAGALTHASVGNVEVYAASRGPIHPVSEPGLLGSTLRRVRPARMRTWPGDLVAVVSDGISSRELDVRRYATLPLDAAAAAIVNEHGAARDDAACLVLRC